MSAKETEPADPAVAALETWMATHSAALGWHPLPGGGGGEFDLGDSPHSAVLQAEDGEWQLRLQTAKGGSLPVLGAVDSSLDVLLDALMFAVYMRATAELDRDDRTASVQLSQLLHELAEATDDARYGGRAALLLASHAITDGQPLEARSRVEHAIRLFATARDVTAEENARTVLATLPRG